MLRRTLLIAVAVAVAAVAAGSAAPAEKAQLTVYAAASLTNVFPQIDKAQRYSFGGSNTLAAQIQQGAPADVFASANTTLPAGLYAKKLCSKPVVFTRNTLVIVVPKSNPANLRSVYDLARKGVKLVIAGPGVPVRFITSAAEQLPFTAGAFDVVLCRVSIPYTDNRAALAEMARVLRPGGILLLKTHHLRFYTRKFVDGVRRRSPLFSLHAVRVLVSGAIFHLTGRQPAGGLLLRESFMTERRLRKELDRLGLGIDGELADSNPFTPSYRVVKRSGRA